MCLQECYVPTADDDIRYSAPEESFTDMGRSPLSWFKKHAGRTLEMVSNKFEGRISSLV